MAWLKARLREGTTKAGLLTLLPQAISIAVTGPTPENVTGLIISALCVIVPEARSNG